MNETLRNNSLIVVYLIDLSLVYWSANSVKCISKYLYIM